MFPKHPTNHLFRFFFLELTIIFFILLQRSSFFLSVISSKGAAFSLHPHYFVLLVSFSAGWVICFLYLHFLSLFFFPFSHLYYTKREIISMQKGTKKGKLKRHFIFISTGGGGCICLLMLVYVNIIIAHFQCFWHVCVCVLPYLFSRTNKCWQCKLLYEAFRGFSCFLTQICIIQKYKKKIQFLGNNKIWKHIHLCFSQMKWQNVGINISLIYYFPLLGHLLVYN